MALLSELATAGLVEDLSSMNADGLRLSVGTLTAIPVAAPSRIDRDVARSAMILAPLAVLPIGAGRRLRRRPRQLGRDCPRWSPPPW